jgi:hypothetical protein
MAPGGIDDQSSHDPEDQPRPAQAAPEAVRLIWHGAAGERYRWFYGVFQSAPDLIRWLAGPDDRSLADQPVPTDLDRQYGAGPGALDADRRAHRHQGGHHEEGRPY